MKLEKIKQRYEKVLEKLSDPELISDPEKLEQFSRKKRYLEKIIKVKEKRFHNVRKPC